MRSLLGLLLICIPILVAGGAGASDVGPVHIGASAPGITLGQNFSGDLPNVVKVQGVGFWYLVEAPTATAVGDLPPELEWTNALEQNAPNPFNPTTTIRFSLAETGHAVMELFDTRGRRVSVLIDQELEAGQHELVFRPTDLASGVYHYRLSTGGFEEIRSLVLLK